jgi:hypothetical protein
MIWIKPNAKAYRRRHPGGEHRRSSAAEAAVASFLLRGRCRDIAGIRPQASAAGRHDFPNAVRGRARSRLIRSGGAPMPEETEPSVTMISANAERCAKAYHSMADTMILVAGSREVIDRSRAAIRRVDELLSKSAG